MCVYVRVCPEFSHRAQAHLALLDNTTGLLAPQEKKQNFPLLRIQSWSAAPLESNTSLTVAGHSLASLLQLHSSSFVFFAILFGYVLVGNLSVHCGSST